MNVRMPQAASGLHCGQFRSLLVLILLLCSGCSIHQSFGKSTGAFLHPVSGNAFTPVPDDQWDPRNALVYFYRTHSQWAADEIESPSVYVDDRHYFNLRDGSYTWLEMAPGERHIVMRRPLLGFEGVNSFSLRLIADGILRVEPGQVYFLRYNELTEAAEVHPQLDELHPFARGELQMVTEDYALTEQEIFSTRFLNSDLLAPNHAGISIADSNVDTDYERRMQALKTERELEIERLKASGSYRAAPWYWPFGGGSGQPLLTDQKIEQLEQDYEEILEQRKRRKQAESGGHWWHFW